jgi:hypothetical protein
MRAVGEAEKHYQGLKESSVGTEGGFPLITLFYPDVVETPSDI